jgi:hypothetical protein
MCWSLQDRTEFAQQDTLYWLRTLRVSIRMGFILCRCHDVELSCGGAYFVAPLAKQGQAALTGLWLEQPLQPAHKGLHS